MPAKPKRSKEEIAAERARKEEEARLAEEERLRQEEAARKAAEQRERVRLQLVAEYEAARDARLAAQRPEVLQLLAELQQARSAAAQQAAARAAWQRHLACNPLPQPSERSAMNDFFNTLADGDSSSSSSRDACQPVNSAETLKECKACMQLAKDCLLAAEEERLAAGALAAAAALAGGPQAPEAAAAAAAADGQDCSTGTACSELASAAAAAVASAEARAHQYRADVQQLYGILRRKIDRMTAQLLHCADERADEKGEALLTAQAGRLQWGLWASMHRGGTRFKLTIDFGPELGLSVEVPKTVALLPNVAVRALRLPSAAHCVAPASTDDGGAAGAHCCLVPLGGVLELQLLASAARAKHVKGWTMRQPTPASTTVLPYPIPPAGVDAASWQPEEPPPPFVVSMALPQQLLMPAAIRMGWWDERRGTWSEDGISDVSYDSSSHRVRFSSSHLGRLALLQDTAAALPLSSWTIRPTGRKGGTSAAITLQVQGLCDGGQQQLEVMLEVGPMGHVTLQAPQLPQLSHLLGQAMPPVPLLAAAREAGLFLTPGEREAHAAGLQPKDWATEAAMCADVALLCGSFLVACSRWNRLAGPQVALVRLSEVSDWDEGGRTQPQHAARIFSREAAQGERRVLVARRQGLQGVAFVDGADGRTEPPPLPDFSSADGVAAAGKEAFCHLHAVLSHLLASGPAACVEQRALALAASEQALQQVRATDAVFTGTLTQVLLALRVFTAA